MTQRKHPLPTIGERFGRWTVVSLPEKGRYSIECVCDCGTRRWVAHSNLSNGGSLSCGCYSREVTSTRNLKHGEARTRLHKIWCGMIKRCLHPGNERTRKHYYDRGIQVCDEWRHSYEAFAKWARENGYRDDLQIDRIDNARNYEPSNCRWVSLTQNQRNKSSNHFLEAFGETKCISEWATDPRCVVSAKILSGRIRENWNPELAITRQIGIYRRGEEHDPTERNRLVSAFGETKSLASWAFDARCVADYHALKKRLNRGWPPERAITEPARKSKLSG